MFKHSRELLLCEWLKKAIVHHVIGCLGKQKGRQNLEQYDWWIRVLSKWAATQIDVLHHKFVVNATILAYWLGKRVMKVRKKKTKKNTKTGVL